MKTNAIYKGRLLPLALAAVLFAGCGGSDHDGPVGTERMEQGTIRGDRTADGNDRDRDATADRDRDGRTDADRDARTATTNARTGTADRNDQERNDRDRNDRELSDRERADRDRVERDDEKDLSADRRAALDEIRDMRNELENELAAVRERLSDGTRPPQERNADQARAAALAQGLQQLGSARSDIRSASDDDWVKIRDRNRNEVKDLRVRLDRGRNDRD